MINLLPPEVKSDIKFARMNVSLIQYVILVAIVSFSLLGILFVGTAELSATKTEVEQSIIKDQQTANELETYHNQAKSLQSQITTLSNLLGREIKFSELIIEIGRVMPPGGVLTQLTLTEDKTAPINLIAQTTNEDVAAILRKNLAESDLFTKADITSLTAKTDPTYKNEVNIVVTFAVDNPLPAPEPDEISEEQQ